MANYDHEYIIVLHIEEGIGLNFKNNPIIVSASLGGNALETEAMPPGTTTIFDNNLIWETDKKSIRKMKTENLPIKITCYSVDVSNNSQEPNKIIIGNILISIRGVAVLPATKAVNTKLHWYKLIGVSPDYKPLNPELCMYVVITDKRHVIINDGQFLVNSELSYDIDSINADTNPNDNMLRSQQGIFIQLLQDEGLLQIGEIETNCDIFVVKIILLNGKQMQKMLNENDSQNQLFHMQYTLLGTQSQCTLNKKFDNNYGIQEKIAIHFRSSLRMLKEYFHKVLYIPIDLYYDDAIVGHTRLSFDNILKFENLEDFLNVCSINNNIYESDETCFITSLKELPQYDEKPSIEFKFSIKYMSSSKLCNYEIVEAKDELCEAEFYDNIGGGDSSLIKPTSPLILSDHNKTQPINNNLALVSGDAIQLDTIQLHQLKSNRSIITKLEPPQQEQKQQSPHQLQPQTILDITKKTDIDTLLKQTSEQKPIKNIPRTFSFNLVIQSIKFIRKPDIGIWQISFHHPKADTPYTLINIELKDIFSEFIDFQNLELQLYFSSVVDDFIKLVESESCVLNINGPHGVHARADLDNESLLIGTKEHKVGIILMENQSGEQIAMANVFVYLDDLGINCNSKLKKYANFKSVPPRPYLDENLAYKIVEELEEWKLKQQELFLIELKRKEINHLAKLSTEWQRKRVEQETRLNEKIEQCNRLTVALEEAHNNLKVKGVKNLNEEKIVEQTKLELEKTYTTKMLLLQEKNRRLEDDMDHQLKIIELKYKEIELSKAALVRENEQLKETINELEIKNIELEKNLLPKDQLAGLFQDLRILNERLENVQKSKLFYKEQWARLIREIHQIKSENLQQMEIQIRQNKTMGIQNILECEQSQLNSERDELQEIKMTLNENS